MRERPVLKNVKVVIHGPGRGKRARHDRVLAFREVLIVRVEDDHDVFVWSGAARLGRRVLREGFAELVVGVVCLDCSGDLSHAEFEEGAKEDCCWDGVEVLVAWYCR